MSTNITIQEGGNDYQFSVASLQTDLDGGGTCLWVPPGGGNLTRKSIHENGIYVAGDDGYYAYSVVNVDVDTDKGVTGKSTTDGKTHHIGVDPETGALTDGIVPDRIEVVTPPDYTGPYHGGDLISVEGLVVKSYSGAEDLGIVPLTELFFPMMTVPTIAYDPYVYYDGMTYYVSTGAQANLGIVSSGIVHSGMGTYVSAHVPSGLRFVFGGNFDSGFVVCAISREPFSSGMRYGTATVITAAGYPVPITEGGEYGYQTIDGMNYYYGYMVIRASSTKAYNLVPLQHYQGTDTKKKYVRRAINHCYGPNATGGGNLAVPIRYSRPGDGVVLEAKFMATITNVMGGDEA